MDNPPLLAFDLLDPWGWVAVRRLAVAMHQAGKKLDIIFQPCRSSLSRAATGMTYPDYLERRFGTEAVVHQSLVAAELRKLAIEPGFGKILTVPDTRPALAAVLWLQRSGRPAQAFVERVYEALFCQAEDIGALSTLERILGPEGVAFRDIEAFIESQAFSQELDETEAMAAAWTGRVIPSVRINGTVVYGAQTPGVLAPMFA
ncbi:putative dithiol-disulfide isomerase involved in polyketide biosynthesis [Pseudomonas asplenii]|uniref:Putative dithiol-disulfide isomerase involved in polyketide biosynthesis n=1 Tax=Pseudomonas asplenii TaxID=53407 RepID=A0A0N0E1H3_9PSED|nr:DsbA family protein [Pseudomonas fuscovaginae]KPA87699.1 putative dithiol-disulfide isomerase involved in polyketide biosynthesis [Pseudomonas fuscovaginae]